MFTYLNSAKDQILFRVELRKIDLTPLKNDPVLRMVSLVVGQPGKESHRLELGVYKLSSDLLDGLASVNEWANGRTYVTLENLRERLEKSYSSPVLNYDLE